MGIYIDKENGGLLFSNSKEQKVFLIENDFIYYNYFRLDRTLDDEINFGCGGVDIDTFYKL